MTIWILVAAAAWKRLPSGSVFRDLLPLAGVYILVGLAMFPNFDDRFFVWAYLLAGAVLIQTAQIPASDLPEDAGLREDLRTAMQETHSRRLR